MDVCVQDGQVRMAEIVLLDAVHSRRDFYLSMQVRWWVNNEEEEDDRRLQDLCPEVSFG